MNKKEGIVSETKAIQKKLTERKTVLQSFFQTASVEFKDYWRIIENYNEILL